MNKTKWYTEKAVFIVPMQMHFMQRKHIGETNVTLHAFQQTSDFKIFPEWFRGPLKTFGGPHAARGPAVGPHWHKE